MRLEPTDLAYAAGFLDGEGCFTIGSSWRIQITCTNTCREVIEWFCDRFGGYFRGPITPRKENWRPTYEWKVSNQQAKAVLEQISPFLREKAAQASLLMQMQETMDCGRRLTPEILAVRHRIKQEIKELKRCV